MYNLTKLFTVAAFFSLAGNGAHGTTYAAADVSLAAVQAAVNAATNGDTVLIPPGTAIWTNGLTIYNKGINLIGAGVTNTFIIDADPVHNHMIDSEHSYPHFIRISGFSITGGNLATSVAEINIGSTLQSNCFRVDNIQITNLTKYGVQVSGYSMGVIDHCYFSSVLGATGIAVNGEGAYTWDVRPPTWGDTNKVYVEDCSFFWSAQAGNANGAIDSYNGARWCFRHNFVTNINIGDHGTDSSGSARGTHSYEIYNNTIVGTVQGTYLFFDFRGGSGILFSNTLTYIHGYPLIGLLNYRNAGTNIYGPANPPCCNPWGPINGINPLDGNTDPYGYPPYDSPGRTSPTAYYTNVPTPSYTNFVLNPANLLTFLSNAPVDYTIADYTLILSNLSNATNGFTAQAAQPCYEWSNTANGGPLVFSVGNIYTNLGSYYLIPSDNAEILANRDYFDNIVMSNYVVYAVSNNALVSVATNAYTPLVYPHPLVTAGTLLPPSNLHVVTPGG